MKKFLVPLLILLGGAGLFWYLYNQRLTEFAARPFGAEQARLVDIPRGTGPKGVAALLAEKGVVSDADLLYGWLRREKLGPKLRAGEYEFTGALTPADVIQKIIAGRVKQYRFTVPEGLRVDEILPLIAACGLGFDQKKLQELADSPVFAHQLGIPADRFEGFLFPDTYTFTRGATEETVLSRMVARTLEELKKAQRHTKAGVQLNPLQAITLASIVEKETGVPEERPRISCVFHNRLRRGMKLQTDPTVLYAMLLLRGTYSNNLTRQDLETSHPYNTYTISGLPPGPIASPSAAAIQAALNPADCQDLFFVSRNDGSHVFCADIRCHGAHVQHFQKDFFNSRQNSSPKRR